MSFLSKYHFNLIKFVQLVLKFGVTGAIGFVVNYSVLHYLTATHHTQKLTAEIIATAVALQITFILNNYWTYSQLTTENELILSLRKRYIAFITSNLVGSLVTIVAFGVLSTYLKADFVSLLVAAIFGMTWNFFANLFVTWQPKAEVPAYSETID